MTKRKNDQDDTEYRGDPSASWNDSPSASKNDGFYGPDVEEDNELEDRAEGNFDRGRRSGSNRINVRDLPEDKIETVDLNKPLDVSDDPILNQGTFTNRTGMAWWSLYMMVGLVIVLFLFLFVVLGLFMYNAEVMKGFTNEYKVYLEWSSTFIGWGFSSFSAVILAYMGATAFFYSSYMKNMKK